MSALTKAEARIRLASTCGRLVPGFARRGQCADVVFQRLCEALHHVLVADPDTAATTLRDALQAVAWPGVPDD